MQTLAMAASCQRCAMPATSPGAPCPHCNGNGRFPFDQIISLGVYRSPLKNMIHHAKYSNRWPLAELLAERLFERTDVQHLLMKADCLIPMPLHRRRQVHRGYNQADVIARRISSLSKKPVKSPAMRIRDTQTQTVVHSRAAREENVRDAFVLAKPAMVTGKNIIVIDDVMTTGATMVSLARTLKAAKPASISSLVLAVADPKGREFEVI